MQWRVTLHDFWKRTKNLEQFQSTLDPIHTGLQIIVSMLVNPEDAKEDNFILQDDMYLIPIDNDHAFIPSSYKEKGIFYVYDTLQTKTVLFCLDIMNTVVPKEVCKVLSSMNTKEFMLNFLDDMDQTTIRYALLFTKEEQARFFKDYNVVTKTPMDPMFVERMCRNLELLLCMLKTHSAVNLTYFQLLASIEPYLERIYSGEFKKRMSRLDLIPQHQKCTRTRMTNKACPLAELL
jgi:hypothetical protein